VLIGGVVVAVAHDEFKGKGLEDVSKCMNIKPVLVDAWGLFSEEGAKKKCFYYKSSQNNIGRKKMDAIKYIAKVLPDGHLSLPEEIKEKMGLTANSRVKVVLEIEAQRDKAIEAFGAWSERSDIKDGVEYVEKMRAGWSERTARIENV